MIREALTAVQPEITSPESIEAAASVIGDKLLFRGKLIVNKTGLTGESTLCAALDALQKASQRELYTAPDGRPVRFFVYHVTTEQLAKMMWSQKHEELIGPMARFATTDSSFVKRIRSQIPELQPHLYGRDKYPPIDETADDGTIVKQAIAIDFLRTDSSLAMNLRQALKRFGNPPTYRDENSHEPHTEQDPTFPMMIPVFNITFSSSFTNDPLSFLSDFNRRFAPHSEDFYEGKIKISEIFSQVEMDYANQCAAIVSLVDQSLYQAWELPRTYLGIFAPLFPYEVISLRNGYAYEAWLPMGPNDELMDTINSARPEKI